MIKRLKNKANLLIKEQGKQQHHNVFAADVWHQPLQKKIQRQKQKKKQKIRKDHDLHSGYLYQNNGAKRRKNQKTRCRNLSKPYLTLWNLALKKASGKT